MNIDEIRKYSEKVCKILDNFDEFCNSIESETVSSLMTNQKGPELEQIKEKIIKIDICESNRKSKEVSYKEKVIAFLYTETFKFLKTNKVNKIPISQKFLSNMNALLRHQNCVHHSHVTGNIIGYAHTFCNKKVRENYYSIPVIAHNLFRFDFFFFIKGVRSSVWQTTDINIGEKNPTDINFATIGNQVKFVDTIKYFQQSSGSLTESLTDSEKAKIRVTCETFYI